MSEKVLSKNSISNLSKKAGVKSISNCAIEKIKELVNEKILEISQKLSDYYVLKNKKTMSSKIVCDFLELENINITNNK